MEAPAYSTTAEIYVQAHEHTALPTAMYSPRVWERLVDGMYSIPRRTHLENFFHTVNNFRQNIKFIMGQESNGELPFLDTLLKRDNEKISVLVHRKPTHSDQYLYCSFHHQTGCKGSFVSSFFFLFFFLSGFSFTNIHGSQDCRGRGRAFL